MTSRRSPAAPPLEDDDLLCEILLLLPPQPSSLPRSSLVSKAWRRVALDPHFSQRFRLQHRHDPPLLGFFDDIRFIPTLDPPNRVPEDRFTLPLDHDHGDHRVLGCRHGLVLVLTLVKHRGRPKGYPVLVWDPVTGDQHRIALPAAFNMGKTCWIGGAVLRRAGSVHSFQVVLLLSDDRNGRILAWFYSSETGAWSDPIPTQLPSLSSGFDTFACKPAVLVGGSLYWLLLGTWSRTTAGISSKILEFDLDRQSLGVINAPPPAQSDRILSSQCLVLQADGAGLAFLLVLGYKGQLWNMKTDPNGVASWTLERTIELDNLLSVNPGNKARVSIYGYAELNNVILVETCIGLFTIQLDSWEFKKLLGDPTLTCHHAFESVYAAGKGIDGGGHGGAELVHNA